MNCNFNSISNLVIYMYIYNKSILVMSLIVVVVFEKRYRTKKYRK